MDMNSINDKIKNTIDYGVIEQLTDVNLMDDYKKTESVKKEINDLIAVLEKNKIEDKKILVLNNVYNNTIEQNLKINFDIDKYFDKFILNKSLLSAAIGTNDGIVYQMKGPKNSKPKEEYHPYIVDTI